MESINDNASAESDLVLSKTKEMLDKFTSSKKHALCLMLEDGKLTLSINAQNIQITAG